MNDNVIIISEADLLDDPAFAHPFKANKLNDFKAAVGKAIARWRLYNPNQDFLEASCRCWLRRRCSVLFGTSRS
jgi:hypothetical protein